MKLLDFQGYPRQNRRWPRPLIHHDEHPGRLEDGCAIRGHPQIGFRCFMSMTVAMTSRLGPFGPGFVGLVDEKSRRYVRWISARCRLNSVDGLKTIVERMNRRGRITSAHRATTTRSERRRLGDRFRDRLRISSWCLTSTDSATTDRAPPGRASRATVASRCRTRTARARTARCYQVRDNLEECSGIWNSPRTGGEGHPVRRRACACPSTHIPTATVV
jgi:hypothetical protein